MDNQLSFFNEIAKDEQEIRKVIENITGVPDPRELNSMYWTDRLHLICCVRRKTLECPNNYSDKCEVYNAIMKEYSEDLYYKHKRMVVNDDELNKFKPLFKL
jgi:hypothetical protein